MTLVEARNLPRHVAIIMDGNGRWAQQQGLPRTVGHERGSAAVRKIVRVARRLGVQALTLFAFSEQNWSRPEGEVSTLMTLLRDYLLSEHDELVQNGIRLRAIGDLERLPASVREVLEPLQRSTVDNRGMVLSLALSYGGREEIAQAARDLARAAVRGEIDPEAIDDALLASRIPSVSVGDPDLLIRTGGELRVSNFLLWGAAYSELHFSPVLWPDFTEEDFFGAVAAYQARERRFGLTSAQIRTASRESEPAPSDEAAQQRPAPAAATSEPRSGAAVYEVARALGHGR